MKTNTLLFTLLITMTLLVSCNKQEESSPPVPKIKTIYTFQNSKLINSQSLERDLSGRLIKITVKSGAYTSYTYLDNSILKKEFDAQSVLTDCDTLVLNPQGLVVTGEHGSKTFTYNANSYLTSAVTLAVSLLFDIEDGNAVSENYLYPNSTATVNMNWFLDNSVNTIGNENMGIFFYGKQDRQLLKMKNFMSKTWTYQYEYDAQKRVYHCSRKDGTSETYFTYLYEE